jgi:hypothetical protein
MTLMTFFIFCRYILYSWLPEMLEKLNMIFCLSISAFQTAVRKCYIQSDYVLTLDQFEAGTNQDKYKNIPFLFMIKCVKSFLQFPVTSNSKIGILLHLS